MTFIMVMVVTMMTDQDYEHDMVTEGYYEKELVYQEEIDAETNAQKLSSGVRIEKNDMGWLIYFPKEMNIYNSSGQVDLYRPSNKALDFTMPLDISEGTMLIPDAKLLKGLWKLTLSWEMNSEAYLFKKELQY